MFTAEFIAALGEAVVFSEGDVLYITNNAWALVLTNPALYISPEKLEVIRDSTKPVNWEFLCADEFFPSEQRFIPRGGTHAKWLHGANVTGATAQQIKDLTEHESASIWGDLISLDELFRKGKARPIYSHGAEHGSKRAFTLGHATKCYLFDLDGRFLAVNAEWFQAFANNDFSITVRADLSSESHGKPIGLAHGDDVIGFLMPLSSSEIHTDKQGRDLYLDITYVSWFTPEEGVAQLQSPSSYEARELDATEVVKRDASSGLLLGVAVLRWHGLSDDEINILHHDGREAGIRSKIDTIQEQLGAMLHALKTNKIVARKTWELDRHFHWLAGITKSLVALSHAIDIRPETELVAEVEDELEEMKQRLSRAS